MNVTTQGIGHKVMSVLMALVLAIGLAPMVPAGTAWAVDTEQESWAAGTFKYNATADEDGVYSFEYTDSAVTFAVDSVTDVYGNALTAGEDYTVGYYKDANGDGEFGAGEGQTGEADGAAKAGAAPSEPGDYFLVVFKGKVQLPTGVAGAQGQGIAYKEQAFTIEEPEATSIKDAVLYVVNGDDPSDISNTRIEYTGEDIKFGTADGNLNLAVNGKPLDPNTDFTASVSQNNVSTYPHNAGTYQAVFSGNESAGYTDTVYTTITVNKVDLNNADVSIVDQQWGGSAKTIDGSVAYINGRVVKDDDPATNDWQFSVGKDVTYTITDYQGVGASGTPTQIVGAGHYAVEVTATDDAANVTGSKTVEFDVVTDLVSDFSYTKNEGEDTAKKNTFADWNASKLVFDTSKGEAFDAESIAVGPDGSELKAEAYDVVVTKDGQEVTSFAEPGDYVATVKVKVGENYAQGGTGILNFRVIDGRIAADSVFVAVNGKNIPGTGSAVKAATYTGEAIVPAVAVKCGDETLTAGTDYTVSYEKKGTDGEWAAVESIVDAGVYRVVVESDGYDMPTSGVDFTFEVGKVVITGYRAVQQEFGGETGIIYTGSAITPAIQYTDGTVDEAGEVVYKDLDASLYTLTYKQKVTEGSTVTYPEVDAADVVGPGSNFIAIVELTEDAAVNYTAPTAQYADEAYFNIIERVTYYDVLASDWFVDVVYQATGLEYMSGYVNTDDGKGGRFFLPNAAINRAEIAQVLYNMAGGKIGSVSGQPGFDDVADTWTWAYQAINFVTDAEIMTGYGPEFTSFGPGDNATREQIATVMYRYAQLKGEDVSVADVEATLGTYADGDQVQDYARTAMAWAVEHEVMGVDTDVLRPADNVSRAETAAIAVRVQPERLVVQ